MILIDAGPLVALLNARDQDHNECVSAAGKIPDVELTTTWPCFTEAMYLLFREGGLRYQEALWQFRRSGILSIHVTAIVQRGKFPRRTIEAPIWNDPAANGLNP